MNLKYVRIEESGKVATVILNRPDVRNAFDPQMMADLTEAFRTLGASKDLSVLILRGEGKAFSAGADLGYMKAMAAFTIEENQRDAEKLDQMFWTMRECPLPIIGRIHGHAMGGALGLTAVCDIAGAVEGTQFAFSEVRLGLAPAVISPYVLEKMEPSFAYRTMLTAEAFDARVAHAAGLVQFVGPEAEVDAFVTKMASTIAANGPEAVRATKKLMREVSNEKDWSKKRARTTRVIAERRVSEEGQEGLRGFLEKRDPAWRTVKG